MKDRPPTGLQPILTLFQPTFTWSINRGGEREWLLYIILYQNRYQINHKYVYMSTLTYEKIRRISFEGMSLKGYLYMWDPVMTSNWTLLTTLNKSKKCIIIWNKLLDICIMQQNFLHLVLLKGGGVESIEDILFIFFTKKLSPRPYP